MKFEELWHHLSGYAVYVIGAMIAFFVDSIVAVLSYIFSIPMMGEANLKSYVVEGTESVMNKDEFIIRVIDGHLWIWDLAFNELLQNAVLSATLLATLIKAFIDLHGWYTKRKKEKFPNDRRKRKSN